MYVHVFVHPGTKKNGGAISMRGGNIIKIMLCYKYVFAHRNILIRCVCTRVCSGGAKKTVESWNDVFASCSLSMCRKVLIRGVSKAM